MVELKVSYNGSLSAAAHAHNPAAASTYPHPRDHSAITAKAPHHVTLQRPPVDSGLPHDTMAAEAQASMDALGAAESDEAAAATTTKLTILKWCRRCWPIKSSIDAPTEACQTTCPNVQEDPIITVVWPPDTLPGT